jgi:hypothetical protein
VNNWDATSPERIEVDLTGYQWEVLDCEMDNANSDGIHTGVFEDAAVADAIREEGWKHFTYKEEAPLSGTAVISLPATHWSFAVQRLELSAQDYEQLGHPAVAQELRELAAWIRSQI